MLFGRRYTRTKDQLSSPHLKTTPMERFTISIDTSLALQFDALMSERGYSNRSEAIRDLIRRAIEDDRQSKPPSGHCVANLSYVYDHHQRDLAERLTTIQHKHHDLTVATMHAHLDHESCLETAILRGPTVEVLRFANSITAECGVRHGNINLISLTPGSAHAHRHGKGEKTHVHFPPVR